jgi:hypothetical protein
MMGALPMPLLCHVPEPGDSYAHIHTISDSSL